MINIGIGIRVGRLRRKLTTYYDYLLWIIRGNSTDIEELSGGGYGFKNFGQGTLQTPIHNVQVATFNSIAYISVNLTGLTIASYEGTAIPTKTNDSRIDVTTGQIYSITLSDGKTWYANEGSGVSLYFRDDLGNILIGILNSAVEADFWANTSDVAYDALQRYGGSKYLNCISAGVISTLASPLSDNLGSEEVINGGFDSDLTDWTLLSPSGIKEVIDGRLKLTTNDANVVYIGRNISLEVGKWYIYEVDGFIGNANSLKIAAFSGGPLIGQDIIYKDGKLRIFFIPTIVSMAIYLYLQDTLNLGHYCYFDNASIKEVLPIDLTTQENIISYKIKSVGISNFYFVASTPNATGNGYMVQTTSSAITLYRNDAGSLTQLATKSMTINNYDEITAIINSGLSIKVNGVEQLTSNDTTYTDTSFIVIDNDASDSIYDIKLNGQRFDVDNFITQSGSFGVQKVIGVGGGLDAKGNEVEYLPNAGFWNTGNTIVLPDDSTITDALTTAGLSNLAYPNENTVDDFLNADLSGVDPTVVTMIQDFDNRLIKNLAIAKQ